MKKLVPLFLLLLAAGLLQAQKIDSLWTTPFDFEVNQIATAPDGTVIIATYETTRPNDTRQMATVLTAVNPETGAVKWRYPAAFTKENMNIKGIEVVPNTPFIMPANVPVTVIDPYDGKILVDALRENITDIDDFGFLLESGHAWISGTTNGERSLSVFDLRSGKKLYSNTEFFKEKSKGAAKLGKLAAMTGATGPGMKGPIKLSCKPINHGMNNMILATTNGIYHVNIASGQVDWEAELPDPNKGKAIKVEVGDGSVRLLPGRGETFFVIKPAYMIAMNYSDGKPAWKSPVKTSGPIDQIIYDQSGLILCPGSSNQEGVIASGYVKLVDEKTGNELWGDGVKFNGGIRNYLYTEKGLAVAMVNSSSNRNSINFIDVASGKFLLPKNVNVDGRLEYLELTPKGLLFKSDREVNIIGLDTDKRLMSLPVQSKTDMPILSVNGQDHVYFYSDDDKSIIDIDKTNGASKVLNKEKIKFQGDERPVFIDLRNDGVCVYSAQNATLVKFDGTAKYNVYHPGVRTLMTTLNKIDAAVSVYASVMNVASAAMDASEVGKASLQLGANQTPAQQAELRNSFSQLQQAYSSVGPASFVLSLERFKTLKGRLEASAQSKNEIYMMTKVDDRSVLLGINKDSGEAVSKVLLAKRDKEPLYQLDSESGYLYYAPKGSNIIGWSTKKNSVTGYRTAAK